MYSFKTIITICLIGLTLPSAAQLAAPQQDSATQNTEPFSKVDVEAEFPGGLPAWRKFLEKNLKSEVPANNEAPVGRYTAIVRFIVDKDGSISDIRTETKIGYGIEEEVMRVISKSGKWTPAAQNGRPVKAYRRQPVIFILDSDDFTITTEEPYTFFTGIDNIVTVEAGKVKPENISLTVQGGTATPTADGKFIVRVKKAGRVMIEIYNTKKDKSIGTASFEVRTK